MTAIPANSLTPHARRAQAAFRAALDALARPGSIAVLPELSDFADPRAAGAWTLLQALVDHEVSVALSGTADPRLERSVQTTTGAAVAPAERADFLLALTDPGATFLGLKRGEPEVPEEGATVIVAADAVGEGDLTLLITGPGVEGERRLRLRGLSPESVSFRNTACAAFPLGIDVFLVDARGRCAGIPRGSRVSVEVA